ncbi:hypothetical protein T03_18116 [Trichinella britovi]|uniref:Uncharacterized protein n=1 Tax=Trichinella britovi TaxID=45882 RepID=A0A0V1CX08_TRIBR|nr:hypothetical protein T03_18116 [Trichinella britovi]
MLCEMLYFQFQDIKLNFTVSKIAQLEEKTSLKLEVSLIFTSTRVVGSSTIEIFFNLICSRFAEAFMDVNVMNESSKQRESSMILMLFVGN